MGKDLHHSIPSFIYKRVMEHGNIKNAEYFETDEDLFLKIIRLRGASLIVQLSDGYRYNQIDFLSRPIHVRSNAFVLVARPEAEYDFHLLLDALDAKVGVGKLAKFLGALHKENFWDHKYWDEKRFWEEHAVSTN